MFWCTHARQAARITAAVALPLAVVGAQQSDVSVSPFVSFLPSAGVSPLAGLALTLAGNSGLALRASGHLSLENTNNAALAGMGTSMRPWGGDADAVLFFNRTRTYARALTPYVFTGIGMAARDSLGATTTRSNWSYGAGFSAPIGRGIDAFGESRWRMSRYVLPTAQFAPSAINELRIGVSLHLLGSSRGRAATASVGRMPDVRESYPASATVTPSTARLLTTANRYLGTPYVYGGTTPDGFDCSGFTQYVFAKHGIRLPRTAREQAQVGMSVAPEWRAVAPGDLVMFSEGGSAPISHVAIYAGRNRIIHSSGSGGGVRYDDLSTNRGNWFVSHMVAVRRVTPDPALWMLDLAKGFSDVGIKLDGPDHAPRP